MTKTTKRMMMAKRVTLEFESAKLAAYFTNWVKKFGGVVVDLDPVATTWTRIPAIVIEEEHHVVFRPGPGLPDGFFPENWNGRWEYLRVMDPNAVELVRFGENGIARPTGRYETRGDGAKAEVWEVRLR